MGSMVLFMARGAKVREREWAIASPPRGPGIGGGFLAWPSSRNPALGMAWRLIDAGHRRAAPKGACMAAPASGGGVALGPPGPLPQPPSHALGPAFGKKASRMSRNGILLGVKGGQVGILSVR